MSRNRVAQDDDVMGEGANFSTEQAREVGEAMTAKIALAHLNEFPDYYGRLAIMEAEAETYWRDR